MKYYYVYKTSRTKIYLVTIKEDPHTRIIVSAKNKKDACHKAYGLVNDLVSAKEQRRFGLNPYYLKRFVAFEITDKLENAIYV